MKNYFDNYEFRSYEIAKECQIVLVATLEKKERWENIVNKLKQTK